jgi:hypothetical protein
MTNHDEILLPELAAAQLTDRNIRLIPAIDGADLERVRTAALELARASYGHEHHVPQAQRTTDCEPPELNAVGMPEWQSSCPHLVRLWNAGHAYQLAALNAPETATGCRCNGSGVFHAGGYVENGVYKGHTGVCYGCEGKGWQSPNDVKRNRIYWTRYARLSA